MTKTSSSPAPFFLALVAMAALGWFMSTQSPTGALPSHLQAQATPGPLKHPTAMAFVRHPNMTLTLAQLAPAQ